MDRVKIVHSIGAVSRQTGLSADTIRSWERRYGLIRPQRDAGGIRAYGGDEITRLLLARQATQLGHPIRKVATLDNQAIAALVNTAAVAWDGGERSLESIVNSLLEALLNADTARLNRTILSAAMLMDPGELALGVLVPLLQKVGNLWERGRLAVWQEHLLSELVGTAVRPIERIDKGIKTGNAMLVATPPNELHAFGTLFATTIASSRGFRVHNLGVSIPASEVATAAKRLRARYVVIGVTRALDSIELPHFLEELDRALAPAIAIWVGGASSPEIVKHMGLSRLQAISTLEEFTQIVEQQAFGTA